MQLNQISISINNLIDPKINIKSYSKIEESLLLQIKYLIQKIILSISNNNETNLNNSSMSLLINLQENMILSISYSITLVPIKANKQSVLISSYIQNHENDIEDLIKYHDKINYLDVDIKEIEERVNVFNISKPLFVQILNILVMFSKSFPEEEIAFRNFEINVLSDKEYDFIQHKKINSNLQYVIDIASIKCLNNSKLKSNNTALLLVNNSTVVDIYKKELNLTLQIGNGNKVFLQTLSIPIQKFLDSLHYTGKDFIYEGCD